MTSIFNDTDDLDQDFNPEEVALATSDNNTKQSDSDVTLVTKTATPVKKEPVNEVPKMDEMLAAKLVFVEDNHSKVAQLQDIHDSIVAAESISRQTAEIISLSCEDFLGPRLRLNEFTGIPSKINYAYSKNFLVNKIAAEQSKLGDNIKAALEDVMQYVSYTLDRSQSVANSIPAKLDPSISKIDKGLFIQVGKEMKSVMNVSTAELAEAIEKAEVSAELRAAVTDFIAEVYKSRVCKFIFSRVGDSDIRTAVSVMCHGQDVPTLSLGDILGYLRENYESDLEYIRSEVQFMDGVDKEVQDQLADKLSTAEEFVNEARAVLAKFRTLEAYEELTVVLPMIVAVSNKLLAEIKY